MNLVKNMKGYLAGIAFLIIAIVLIVKLWWLLVSYSILGLIIFLVYIAWGIYKDHVITGADFLIGMPLFMLAWTVMLILLYADKD